MGVGGGVINGIISVASLFFCLVISLAYALDVRRCGVRDEEEEEWVTSGATRH